MNEREKIESEVISYFRFVEESLTSELKGKEFSHNRVKVPYLYMGEGIVNSWANEIFDIAIWNVKDQRFDEIEYPWRDKDGELIYNIIKL